MEFESIMQIVTILVTLVLGAFSKKSTFISNNIIPIQNIVIGLVMAIISWITTKNFSSAIALSGLVAGGTYDIIHNLQKILKKEDK